MSTNYAEQKGDKWDFTLVDSSTGDTLGFNVVREDGKPVWNELDAGYLAQQYFTGAADVTSINPEKKLHLVQDAFNAGFGKEIYDPNDPKRYFKATGMDMRNGQGILGWGLTAVSNTPSAPTPNITNADMELTTGWTNGARNATQKHGGSYSWLVGATEAYQDITNVAKGASCTFSCWLYSTVGEMKIGIDDGISTTYSTTVASGSATWTQKSVTVTISLVATRVRLLLFGAGGYVAYYDDALVTSNPTPAAGICYSNCEANFNSEQYIGLDKQLCRLNSSGNAFLIVAVMPANISSLVTFQVSGTDYLIIFQGTSASYYYMTTTEFLTLSTAVVKTFQFGAWVNTTADTLYANDGDNTIRSTTNPLNGGVAWSAQTIVGAASEAITHMQSRSGALLVDKEDIPYYLDSSGNPQDDLAPECASGKSSTSGKNSLIWLGEYYRPTGTQSLLRAGTSNSWIQPSKFGNNLQNYSGRIQALAANEEYLYAIQDNDSTINILCYRDELIDSVTREVWHPIINLNLSNESTEVIRPDANGDVTDLESCTSGDHYSNVDEAVADDATTVVSETRAGGYYDIYNFGATAITDSITKIVVTVRAKKATTGTCWGAFYIKTNSGIRQGSALPLTDSWADYSCTWEKNPITGVEWTASDLNSIQAGFALDPRNGATGYITQVYITSYYIPSFDCETAWISTVYKTRLWITGDSASDNIWYLPLPSNWGDIIHDDNRSFLSGGTMETPWLHGNFKSDKKEYIDMTLIMGHNYNADDYFTVQYKLLGDTSWSQGVDFTGTSSSMAQTQYLADEIIERSSKMIKFLFTGVTGSTDRTPILLSYDCSAVLFPIVSKIYQTKVRIGEGVVDRQEAPTSNWESLQATCLDNCRVAQHHVTMVEYLTSVSGSTKYVKFLPLSWVSQTTPFRTVVRYENNRPVEYEYNLYLLEIALA